MASVIRWLVDLIARQIEPGLIKLMPNSVHAVFWLQTHFPKSEWDTLLSNQAGFDDSCMRNLATDARRAGLNIHWECEIRF